ncbi:asparagine synthase-related protein [Dyadobacter luticola]|uniref:asparagine synthase (glutamine-hydrolyzing) n=1 Tax=Dyadobacter luticola TaxID=1979387 RepID=A0A5R9KX33_9BACT|nr:asparagine synthetase B family protein [Dyadobacter luticola]TLV00731.1 hypothetical protein FEN17_14715 [Dyadobacter luticola]
MLFEGCFNRKNNPSNQTFTNEFDQSIQCSDGYIFAKRDGTKFFSRDYLGSIQGKEKETRYLSDNLTQSFVSFSLEQFLERNESGVCAWYDEDCKELSLSRDLFGILPLYYSLIPDQSIIFSTNLASLLSHSGIKRNVSIDTQRLSLYGTFLGEPSTPFSSQTFYKGIHAVPPGHIVTIDFESVSVKPYVTFRPSKWSHLKSVEEFGEAFRPLFLNAIDKLLHNGPGKVTSHLSGGLDSSSVSAGIKILAPQEPLITLYNKTNTINTDENLYAISVADKIGSQHYEMLQSDKDFDLLSTFITSGGQPSSSLITPSATSSLMEYAKNLDCTRIFNGSGGDSIVGSGLEMIGIAFDNRQWDLVKTLSRKRAAHYQQSYKYPHWSKYSIEKKEEILLNNLIISKLSTFIFRKDWKGFTHTFQDISSSVGISYSYVIPQITKSLLRRIRKGRINPIDSVLRDELLHADDQFETIAISNFLETGYSKEQYRALSDVFSMQTILANEQAFVMSRHYGVTNCSPFYNKELFELCLAVPDIVKFGDGIGRAHFREAMKGLLPENVRSRSTKTHVRSLGQEVVARIANQAKNLLSDTSRVWEYVDKNKFHSQIAILKNDRIPYEQKSSTLFLISRAVSMALWLEWFSGQR